MSAPHLNWRLVTTGHDADVIDYRKAYVSAEGGVVCQLFPCANPRRAMGAHATAPDMPEDFMGPVMKQHADMIVEAPATLATLTQLCFVIRTGGDVLAACEGAEKQIAKAMGKHA